MNACTFACIYIHACTHHRPQKQSNRTNKPLHPVRNPKPPNMQTSNHQNEKITLPSAHPHPPCPSNQPPHHRPTNNGTPPKWPPGSDVRLSNTHVHPFIRLSVALPRTHVVKPSQTTAASPPSSLLPVSRTYLHAHEQSHQWPRPRSQTSSGTVRKKNTKHTYTALRPGLEPPPTTQPQDA